MTDSYFNELKRGCSKTKIAAAPNYALKTLVPREKINHLWKTADENRWAGQLIYAVAHHHVEDLCQNLLAAAKKKLPETLILFDINMQMDEELKKQAEELFSDLGSICYSFNKN